MKLVCLFMMAKVGDLVNLCKFVTRYFHLLMITKEHNRNKNAQNGHFILREPASQSDLEY